VDRQRSWRYLLTHPSPPKGGQLLIETEDECGGIPQSKGDLFQLFGDRRRSDRSGLGLGLSIARKAVPAHGGEIRIRNMPGKAASSSSKCHSRRKSLFRKR
jgi:signal transduction histidine kinase